MIFTLEAQPRIPGKKSDLNNLRAQGMIPAVLYGPGMESISVSLKESEFTKHFKKSFTELAFWEINLNGKTYHTILKDKLVHPVKRNVLHVDFMVVPAAAKMEFDLPIHFVGDAAGLKEGGFADIIQRTVKISCPADKLPDELKLDVSGLHVGQSLHVRDLPKGDWQYKDHEDVTLIVIHAKKTDSSTPSVEAITETAKDA